MKKPWITVEQKHKLQKYLLHKEGICPECGNAGFDINWEEAGDFCVIDCADSDRECKECWGSGTVDDTCECCEQDYERECVECEGSGWLYRKCNFTAECCLKEALEKYIPEGVMISEQDINAALFSD